MILHYDLGVYLFKFTKTDDFSSDKFSRFNLLIIDHNSMTVINADMTYSDGKFWFSSSGTAVKSDIITSDGFYCGKLKENLAILLFIILIIDFTVFIW